MMVNTANGLALVNRYAVSLTVVAPDGNSGHNWIRPNAHVLGMASPPVGFDVLIGLDVLRECLFLNDGPAGKFTLAF